MGDSPEVPPMGAWAAGHLDETGSAIVQKTVHNHPNTHFYLDKGTPYPGPRDHYAVSPCLRPDYLADGSC